MARWATFAPGRRCWARCRKSIASSRSAFGTFFPRITAGDIDGGMEFFFDTIEGDGAWSRLPEAPRQQLRDNAFTLVGQIRDQRPPYSRRDAESIKMPTLFIGGADTKGLLPQVLQ